MWKTFYSSWATGGSIHWKNKILSHLSFKPEFPNLFGFADLCVEGRMDGSMQMEHAYMHSPAAHKSGDARMHLHTHASASSMAKFWKVQGPVVGCSPGVGTPVLNYLSSSVLPANLITNPSPSLSNLLIRMLKWISPKNWTL